MKKRRVIVTLEIETDANIKALVAAFRRGPSGYFNSRHFAVHQVQANVIVEKRRGK